MSTPDHLTAIWRSGLRCLGSRTWLLRFTPCRLIARKIVAAVTRHYPFYSGCERLANHVIIDRLAGHSEEIAWGTVSGGYSVAAPLGDEVGRTIFYFGDLDRKVTWACSRLVRSGDTVLDIGANLGLVSFVLSAIVGTAGHVHAFEPNPAMVALIEKAIQRNAVSNINLHPFALGSMEGTLELSVPARNAGAASLVPGRLWGGRLSMKTAVPVRTLSAFMSEQGVGHIRLVKMDVEGFEAEVIDGATDAFSADPPDVILFELNDSVPDIRHPTIATLNELGYGFFGLPSKLVRMRACELDLRKPAAMSLNFVAARRGQIYDAVASRLGVR